MARRKKRAPQYPWYLRPLTERQLAAEANRRLGDVYNPQRKQLEEEARSRTATIEAASRAAASLLQSHVGLTQDAYHTATADVQGLGTGYTSEMRDRIGAAQKAASDFMATQGAPASKSPLDVGALSDTVYHGGVDIPGSSLAAQGASATARANEEAGIPLLQGAQDIRQSTQDEEKALLELARTRPELRSQIMDELFKREMDKLQGRIQQQAQDLYAGKFGETVRHDVANESLSSERNKLSRLRYEEQVRQHDLAITQAESQGRNPNASLSRAYGYIVDQKGNPILDKNGKKIPVVKSSTTKSKKEKTNAQYQKAVGEAGSMYEDSRPTTDPDTGLTTPPKRPWRWGNAMRYLQNRFGIKPARARQALIAAGFKPPGKPDRSGNRGGNYGGPGGR